LVEAVDDPRPGFSAGIRQTLKVKKQAMDNSSPAGPGPRMDHHSGRLFNDCQILILKMDLERNLLRCESRRFESEECDCNGFPASNPVPGFIFASFNAHCSRPVEQLNLRPGEVFQARRQ